MNHPLNHSGRISLEERADLRRRMGGEGDLIPDNDIDRAWGEFSADFGSTGLVVNDRTFGNFAGWLLNVWYNFGYSGPCPKLPPEGK